MDMIRGKASRRFLVAEKTDGIFRLRDKSLGTLMLWAVGSQPLQDARSVGPERITIYVLGRVAGTIISEGDTGVEQSAAMDSRANMENPSLAESSRR